MTSYQLRIDDLVGLDLHTLESLRQKPGFITEENGQGWLKRTYSNLRFRDPGFSCYAKETEFILRFTRAGTESQRTGSSGTATRVKLESQQA